MTDGALDPVIHAPARLRIVVTLVTLPAGDTLSYTVTLRGLLDSVSPDQRT